MDKKEETTQSLFEKVPTSVISDILSRLPTKSCLNCKLVCKEWHHVINSPEFFELRSCRSSYFTLLFYGKFCNWKTNFLLLDLDNKDSGVDETGNVSVGVDSMIRFKSDFNLPNQKLQVVNECNGVICLKAQEMWSPYVICNPLTGQFMFVEQSRKPFHSVQGYGLGYCPVSRKFKVLRILMSRFKYVAEIQTLGTDKWRTIGDAPICKERIGAFLHGSLHWYSSKDHDIWSFNFGTEQFLRVSLPDDTKGNNSPDVIVFDSYLCFSCISKDCFQRDVWLMKEYGMKDSWVKQFVMEKGVFGFGGCEWMDLVDESGDGWMPSPLAIMKKLVELNRPRSEELPTPIVWDILSRLPVKACLQCKLVCKDWYRVIIDPEFAQLRRSKGWYASLLIHGRFDKTYFMLLDLEKPTKIGQVGNLIIGDDDTTIPFWFKFANLKGCKLSWINECNGVICLKSTNNCNSLYVCNLLMGQHVIANQVGRPSYDVWLQGLGCYPETHQFKVLIILEHRSGSNYVVEIQTLGTNEWRIVGDAPICEVLSCERGIFLNGSLHWYSYKDKNIWSFNFGNERFSRIPLLDEICCMIHYIDMSVFDSCLCVSKSIVETGGYGCDIWVMKEYGVKDSWVKLYDFDTEDYGLILNLMLRMGDDEQVLAYSNTGRLMLVDMKSGRSKGVSLPMISGHVRPVLFNADFANKLKSAQGSEA